jgi:hypothetical protein
MAPPLHAFGFGLFVENGHFGFEVRRLNIGQQALGEDDDTVAIYGSADYYSWNVANAHRRATGHVHLFGLECVHRPEPPTRGAGQTPAYR